MNIEFRPFVGHYDWGWFQLHQRFLRVGDMTGIMAIDMDTNRTVAGVLFDTWTENSCQAHIVIEEPMVLRHGFLEECFNFVFNTANRKMLLGYVSSNNEKAMKFDKHIGFEEVHRIKDGFADGIDIIIYQMLKENCRFIEQKKEAVNE